MHDLDRRHLVGRWQQVIHESLGDQLALVIVDELLQQRGAKAVRDAAQRHALDDMRVDDRAAIMADHVTPDFRLSQRGIDRHQHHVKLEGVARIHLDAAIFRQAAAGRHLHHMRGLESGLHALRQQMIIAMGDSDEFGPAELLAAAGITDAAGSVDHLVFAKTKLMCRRSASASPSVFARRETPRRRA